jgi:septum formation protein
MKPPTNTLILASQSIYRQQLLSRLGLDFRCIAPHIDETPLTAENTKEMVLRLGKQKAERIQQDHPNAMIIASDQSAECDGMKLGKAGNFENALAQLKQMQGKYVTFYTSLVLRTPEIEHTHIDETQVIFRQLNDAQLAHYLHQEQPYDCAGSFKSEGLGICLFERIDSHDPSALIGLPLITLANWLTDLGLLLTTLSAQVKTKTP